MKNEKKILFGGSRVHYAQDLFLKKNSLDACLTFPSFCVGTVGPLIKCAWKCLSIYLLLDMSNEQTAQFLAFEDKDVLILS